MTGGSPAGPRRTVAGRPNFVGRCDPTVREHSGLPAQVSLRRATVGHLTTRSPAARSVTCSPGVRSTVDAPRGRAVGSRQVSADVQIAAGTQAERSDGRSGAWPGTTRHVPVPEGLVHPAGSTWPARAARLPGVDWRVRRPDGRPRRLSTGNARGACSLPCLAAGRARARSPAATDSSLPCFRYGRWPPCLLSGVRLAGSCPTSVFLGPGW